MCGPEVLASVNPWAQEDWKLERQVATVADADNQGPFAGNRRQQCHHGPWQPGNSAQIIHGYARFVERPILSQVPRSHAGITEEKLDWPTENLVAK